MSTWRAASIASSQCRRSSSNDAPRASTRATALSPARHAPSLFMRAGGLPGGYSEGLKCDVATGGSGLPYTALERTTCSVSIAAAQRLRATAEMAPPVQDAGNSH